MDTANERGWFIRFEAGCDIENSFVLNLRLNRAVERWLCVIRGTSSIEIEERYRKSEKGWKREMRTGPWTEITLFVCMVCIIFPMWKKSESYGAFDSRQITHDNILIDENSFGTNIFTFIDIFPRFSKIKRIISYRNITHRIYVERKCDITNKFLGKNLFSRNLILYIYIKKKNSLHRDRISGKKIN